MIREALEYIVGLKGGYDIVEQKGRTYLVDKNGIAQKEFRGDYQSKIGASTLASIIDYFSGDPDRVFEREKQYIIRVGGIGNVDVMSSVSGEFVRDDLLSVRADLPDGFPFERYMDCLLYTSPSPRD